MPAVMRRLELKIDVTTVGATAGPHAVAVSVVLPPAGVVLRERLLFCLPGGAMARNYFDLAVPGDASFSFARSMAVLGYPVAMVDHLGTGASSVPADGFALRIEEVVAANQCALTHVRDALRAGALASGVPRLPGLRTVGVGHSMGGLLTVLQQAAGAGHDALLLLGYSNNGMREALPQAALAYADDASGARAALNELLRGWHTDAFFELPMPAVARAVYRGGRIPEAAVQALAAVNTRALGVGGLLSMIPGSAGPEMGSIDVPVCLGVGDRDIAGPPRQIPATLPRAPYISLAVLPQTGHNHFVYPSRALLLRLVANWLDAVDTFAATTPSSSHRCQMGMSCPSRGWQ
jgi:pimeloyl-ACP methyl ester carboxylesterase